MVAVDPLIMVAQVGSIALWLKAIGGIVVLWIVFQLIAFYFNIRRFRKIEHIQDHMNRMEKKLDKILAKHR